MLTPKTAKHYGYLLIDDWGVPYYAGRSKNPEHRRKALRKQLGIVEAEMLVSKPLSLADAQQCELETIRFYGRAGIDEGGVLLNKYMASSKGNLGVATARDVVERIRLKAIGRVHSPEWRENIRLSKLGFKYTEASKEKMSKSAIARGTPWVAINAAQAHNTGRKRPPEFGAAVSAARKGMVFPAEHRANLKAAWVRRKENKALLQSGYGHPWRIKDLDKATQEMIA